MASYKFDHISVDKKWQNQWADLGTYNVTSESSKKKYYVLDMFPYPSGAGLHVGHIIGYTCTDVIARFHRLEQFNVLHPMGWDSFGLPAEKYAMRHGAHPKDITKINVNRFKKQLKALGFSYDWKREIFTSSPDYYKWTQYIFGEMFKRGLAYQDELKVNYCPFLGTVLANEEVSNNRAKDGGHEVVQTYRKQWVLKITEFADRLLDDLEELDWPEGIKQQQRNWIGRNYGVLIDFYISKDSKISSFSKGNMDSIRSEGVVLIANKDSELLSDRPSSLDLIYGEDKNLKVNVIWDDYSVNKYGVDFYLYVPNICKEDDKFIEDIRESSSRSIEAVSISDLQSKNVIESKIYKLNDWIFARQRYWGEPMPIHYLSSGETRCLEIDELPLELPENPTYSSGENSMLTPLSRDKEWINVFDQKEQENATRDPNTMPQWAGSCWYYLRFMDPHNKDNLIDPAIEKYWKQVDMYVGGAEHAVLHLMYARFWHKFLYDLKVVSSKEPFKALRNQGLVYADAFMDENNVYYDADNIEKLENGSFKVFGTDISVRKLHEKMSKSKLNGVSPDEIIQQYGADALRLYVLFMGPLDQDKKWDSSAIVGCRRFIDKIYISIKNTRINDDTISDVCRVKLLEIKDLIKNLKFNVAIAKTMIVFKDKDIVKDEMSGAFAKALLALISTMAPHICNELWNYHKFDGCIDTFDIRTIGEISKDTVKRKVIVKINGKFVCNLFTDASLISEDILTYVIDYLYNSRALCKDAIRKKELIDNKGVLIVDLIVN
ncbi:MAG: class I tRNA ligase family protein [Chlamydiia bacterium]|nr:class I tRNA ligase family protein [Chlamydiia bacterium]